MAISNIKSNFHQLIDKIENEELLAAFYQMLSKRNEETTGLLWKSLTKEQQEELLLADEESNDPKNWLSNEDVKEKHRKWLGK